MNLLEWRTANNMDQTQAAEVLGLTQSSVSRIENGEQYPAAAKIEQMHERSGGNITAEDLHAAWKLARAERAA